MHYSTNTRRYACWCNDQNGPKVEYAALVKFGYMLESPWMLRYSLCDDDRVRESGSSELTAVTIRQLRTISRKD